MPFLVPLPVTQFTKDFLLRWAIAFIVLFIGTFSFPHALLPDAGKLLSPYFESTATWIAIHVLHMPQPFTSKLASDSTGMYVHALVLLVATFIMALIWAMLDKKRSRNLRYVLLIIIRYYLAMQLLTYGCSKLFKWQFYLPEPNTLFTTIGNTPKDLLLWSTMGTSRLYTVFCGAVEVLAAVLLLFRKTALAGGLIAAATLLNVFVLNISFDISVKLYSGFLLLLSGILIVLYSKPLFCFFFTKKMASGSVAEPMPVRGNLIYIITKTVIVLLLFTDALWPYVQERNFNDDAARRPLLHGAYNVQTFIRNGDTVPPLLTDTLRWRRLFVHRRGYIITQYMNDDMQDYTLAYDTINHNLLWKEYGIEKEIVFTYRQTEKDGLLLSGLLNNDTIQVVLQKINLATLPALQQDFHWTID